VDSVHRSPLLANIQMVFCQMKPAYVMPSAFTTAGEGGAGGSRTLVQTDSRGAFYALSHLLVVGQGPENGTQTLSYPLYLVAPPGKRHNQPEIASAL
jgi:hypothetical protein